MRHFALILSATALALLGCDAGPDTTGPTGSAVLPLVATGGSGTAYRLNPARFRVVGAGVNRIYDGAGVDELNVDLTPGQYLVTLLDDWVLSEVGEGEDAAVDAVLQSPNPQALEIVEGEVTQLVFRFGVGEDAIAFGDGRGQIIIEVDDGCEPQDFYADADGDGYGDAEVSQSECEAPEGFVADDTDCDDADAAINPDADEVCDGVDNDCDGVVDEGDVCERRVFLSNTRHNGNLGGLAGADARCNQYASNAGLGGTWVAWLSDATTDARDRLNPLAAPYVRLDSLVVANDLADLTDGNLQNPIDLDETLTVQPAQRVWTGTVSDGTAAGSTCVNWTDAVVFGGGDGQNNVTGGGWTALGAARCDFEQAMYCFEL